MDYVASGLVERRRRVEEESDVHRVWRRGGGGCQRGGRGDGGSEGSVDGASVCCRTLSRTDNSYQLELYLRQSLLRAFRTHRAAPASAILALPSASRLKSRPDLVLEQAWNRNDHFTRRSLLVEMFLPGSRFFVAFEVGKSGLSLRLRLQRVKERH